MVQQSEKTTGSAVSTKSAAAPKRKTTTKRKKKASAASTTASATTRKTTRKKRVTRRPPASGDKSSPADGSATDLAADASVAAVPAQIESGQIEAGQIESGPIESEGASKTTAKKTGTRTLKRVKSRKKTVARSDSEEGAAAEAKVARKKTARTRTKPSRDGDDKSSPPKAAVSSSAPPIRERFGAGIVVGREASSNAVDLVDRQTDAVESETNAKAVELKRGSDASKSNDSGQVSDASVPNKPKANTRRRRGGQGKRKKPTSAKETAGTGSLNTKPSIAEALPVAEVESPNSEATTAASPTETAEEAAARVVLKRRPVRRARRSRSRGKSEDKSAKKTETQESQESEAQPEEKNEAAEVANVEELKATTAPNRADTSVAKPEGRGSSSSRGRRRRRGQRGGSSKEKTTAPVAAEVKAPEEEPQLSGDIAVITDDTKNDAISKKGREMIINSTAGAECRIAILHDGRLEEIYIERESATSHVGNIYKGRITNVESSIQAAFVDFGLAKNGFLHISDVLPKYFPNQADATENVGKKVPRRDRPPIQKCFRRGDEVIVQVAKEGVGTKGPTLTTYLSIPGRFVVMMPGMSKLGVSRRIEDDADRRAMRDLLGELTMPEGMGFILRTAGLNRNKRELQSDLNYLNRLWKTVQKRIDSQPAPCELYQESDLVIRTIRDVYSSDFKRIVVDDPAVAAKAKDFLRIAMPRTQGAVVAYQRHEPIFHRYGIEQEIHRIYSRHVPLPSGGSIVIDSTEAMVAIDVNSGKYRDQNDAEETAYRINVEAAEEIARQLRLRDLGGLVVCDFIDMRLDRHKRAVEKALRDALKSHKERARILRMSKFGLIEMTRQRQGPSIKRSVFVDCRHCAGSGLVKTPESMSLEVLRIVQLLSHRKDVAQVVVTVAPDVCALVLNEQRSFLHHLEEKTQKSISILPEPNFTNDEVSYKCVDTRGMPLRIDV